MGLLNPLQVFDSVILVENALMVYLAKDTVMVANFDDPAERESSYAGIHLRIACIIAAAYALGMAMKVQVLTVFEFFEHHIHCVACIRSILICCKHPELYSGWL